MDVDSVSVHLTGYGIGDAPDDGASYRIAVPRMLDLLSAAGARATFFLIAGEAVRHPETVRSIVTAGHEVACHSMTHRMPFDVSTPERARLEISQARAVLEDLAGQEVVGFRAPGWGVTPELASQLVAAGFRYDASSFPSWMFSVLRWSVARRSPPGRGRVGAPTRQGLLGRTAPHVMIRANGHSLVEIPVCTTPLLGIPYYHTLRFLVPDPVFRALGAVARGRRWPSYVLHAVDVLDIGADGLDSRIARHPGMDRPLARKLELARRSLAELGRGRSVVPLRVIADLLPGGRTVSPQDREPSAGGRASA